MRLCLHAARRIREALVAEPPARRRSKSPTGSAALAAARTLVGRLTAAAPAPPGLSRREAELLPWLATDLSYAAIARELDCGPDNARLLAKRLAARLGVHSRASAVARWLRPEAFAVTSANLPERAD